MKIDGRKIRWVDCDWNNDSVFPMGCTVCRVCKYLNFLDYAQSCAPRGSLIERDYKLDRYLRDKKMGTSTKIALHRLLTEE